MRITFLVYFATTVLCSGVAVHMSLVDMIAPLLPPRLHRHLDYVRAGAFYPDAFYSCFSQGDAAEHAHWPPYLDAGIQLIQERRYRRQNTDRLEAFLVGVMTHQVADISWHSLGIHQGLLRKMADSEFHGMYNDAHTVLDVGADLVLLNSMNINRRKISSKWRYSKRDIHALLEMQGYHDISKSKIRVCMNRGRAALHAEKRVSKTGFRMFARRSPLMFDELRTYFAGGITDMYQQIEECLPPLLKWMRRPKHLSNPWDLCQVYHGRKPNRHKRFHMHHVRSAIDPPVELISKRNLFSETKYDLPELGVALPVLNTLDTDHDNSDVEVHGLATRGIVDRFSHSTDRVIEICKDIIHHGHNSGHKNRIKHLRRFDVLPVPAIVMNKNRQTGIRKYPGYGRAMIFWGKHLIVGAPDENVVYMYDEHFQVRRRLHTRDPIKYKGQFATRFGAALAIWQNHLVVSSPGLSKLDLFDCSGKWRGGIKWNGAMKVYGHRGAKLIGETLCASAFFDELFVGAPYLDHDVHSQVGAVYALPIGVLKRALNSHKYVKLNVHKHFMYRGDHSYEQAGKRITYTTQHLYIGSPGISKVHAFQYDTKRMMFNLKEHLHIPQKPTGFGGHLMVGTRDLVFVGAPAKGTERTNNQNGAITIFKHGKAKEIFVHNDFSWFGSAGIGAGNHLYVASPHAAHNHGMLWKIDLRNQRSVELGVPFNTFGAEFGASVATNGTYMAIGMPEYSHSFQVRRGGVVIIPVHK